MPGARYDSSRAAGVALTGRYRRRHRTPAGRYQQEPASDRRRDVRPPGSSSAPQAPALSAVAACRAAHSPCRGCQGSCPTDTPYGSVKGPRRIGSEPSSMCNAPANCRRGLTTHTTSGSGVPPRHRCRSASMTDARRERPGARTARTSSSLLAYEHRKNIGKSGAYDPEIAGSNPGLPASSHTDFAVFYGLSRVGQKCR